MWQSSDYMVPALDIFCFKSPQLFSQAVTERLTDPLTVILLRNKVIAGHLVHMIWDAFLSSHELILLILNDRTDFKRHSPAVLGRDEAINRFTLAHWEWCTHTHTHCFLPLSDTTQVFLLSHKHRKPFRIPLCFSCCGREQALCLWRLPCFSLLHFL